MRLFFIVTAVLTGLFISSGYAVAASDLKGPPSTSVAQDPLSAEGPLKMSAPCAKDENGNCKKTGQAERGEAPKRLGGPDGTPVRAR
jgi:hypothetical protein